MATHPLTIRPGQYEALTGIPPTQPSASPLPAERLPLERALIDAAAYGHYMCGINNDHPGNQAGCVITDDERRRVAAAGIGPDVLDDERFGLISTNMASVLALWQSLQILPDSPFWAASRRRAGIPKVTQGCCIPREALVDEA